MSIVEGTSNSNLKAPQFELLLRQIALYQPAFFFSLRDGVPEFLKLNLFMYSYA